MLVEMVLLEAPKVNSSSGSGFKLVMANRDKMVTMGEAEAAAAEVTGQATTLLTRAMVKPLALPRRPYCSPGQPQFALLDPTLALLP